MRSPPYLTTGPQGPVNGALTLSAASFARAAGFPPEAGEWVTSADPGPLYFGSNGADAGLYIMDGGATADIVDDIDIDGVTLQAGDTVMIINNTGGNLTFDKSICNSGTTVLAVDTVVPNNNGILFAYDGAAGWSCIM